MPNPMLILVVNSGSASLKLDLMEIESPGAPPRRLARGRVERFGPEAGTDFQPGDGQGLRSPKNVPDHQAGVSWFLDNLAHAFGATPPRIAAAAHRIVHGGARFTAPTVLDERVLAELETLSDLAPLHNPQALTAIRAVQSALGANVPMVAVFDTAFHRTLPAHAATYALPHELTERHGLCRFGFHGIAHEYMLLHYAHLAGVPIGEAVLITFQLDGGCSAAAIRGGRSVDTSMGFTPLEGLMMGTRAGDLDPGLLLFLARKRRVSPHMGSPESGLSSGSPKNRGRPVPELLSSEAARRLERSPHETTINPCQRAPPFQFRGRYQSESMKTNSQTVRLLFATAALGALASFVYAGPGPQFWQRAKPVTTFSEAK